MSLAHADRGLDVETTRIGLSPSDLDFPLTEVDSALSRNIPSQSVTSQVLADEELASFLQRQISELFALDDDSAAEIGRRLSGLGSRSTNRNAQLDSALSFVVGPAGSSLVRQRIDGGENEFLLREKGGRSTRIITPLGQKKGGFGNVYLVRDPDLGIDHPHHLQVVKQLREVQVAERVKPNGDWIAASGKKEPNLTRFNREANFAQRLNERGLDGGVTPHYIGRNIRAVDGENGEELYALLRFGFKRGLSLEEFRAGISEGEILPIPLFLRLALHICASVQLVHRDGELIHRDLKPGNLHLNSDGTGVMVIDFGLAKDKNADDVESDALVSRATEEHATLGTGKYLPPEQLGDAANATEASDWYSVYLSLYQLLTGKHPYDYAPEGTTLFRAIQYYEPLEALAHLKELGLPPNLIALFKRGFAKKEEGRPSGKETIQGFLGDGESVDNFLASVKSGKSALLLPKKYQEIVSSGDAPLPSGFNAKNNDKGAQEMYAALSMSHTEKVRSRVGKLLWPAVALTGVVAAGVGAYSFTHRNDAANEGGTTSVQPEKQAPTSQNVTPAAHQVDPAESVQNTSTDQLSSQDIFPSSDLFEGTVVNGKLTKLVLFKGKSSEMTVDAGKMVTFTSGGKVSMVKTEISMEQLEKYSGLSREELYAQKSGLKSMTSFPAFLIISPSGEFVFTINHTGWVSGSNTEASVHTDFKNSRISSQYGDPEHVQTSQKQDDYHRDPRMLRVFESVPPVEKFDSLDGYKKACLGVAESWKNACKNAQQK